MEVAELPVRKPHVAQNSGNNEWYTPAEYIEAARATMGRIDCDPASNELANQLVQARRFYTIDNPGLGLAAPWGDTVWMNPPYSQPLCATFCAELAERVKFVKEACVLVNNATETSWFKVIATLASSILFTGKRVRFYGPNGTKGAPLQGQAVIYIGQHPKRFEESFKGLGWGVRP